MSSVLTGDFVLEAVRARPGALKYAMGGLNEDDECLKTAGRIASKEKNSLYGRTEKVILSLKGLGKASDSAGRLAMAMRADPILGQFKTYNPSAFSRGSCDPTFTSISHPCRGTSSTCKYTEGQNLEHSRPSSKTCWRFTYRFHLNECKTAKGFMVQLKEESGLDDGQVIQTDMADGVGLKIFRVQLSSTESHVLNKVVKLLSQEVQSWFKTDLKDTSLCNVIPQLVNDIVDDDLKIREALGLPGGADFSAAYFST